MTRHHRWMFSLAAAICSALLVPADLVRLLYSGMPAMWVLAYVAYSRDQILAAHKHTETRIGEAETVITEHVDIAAADTLIAIRNGPPNQRKAIYDRPTPLRRV